MFHGLSDGKIEHEPGVGDGGAGVTVRTGVAVRIGVGVRVGAPVAVAIVVGGGNVAVRIGVGVADCAGAFGVDVAVRRGVAVRVAVDLGVLVGVGVGVCLLFLCPASAVPAKHVANKRTVDTTPSPTRCARMTSAGASNVPACACTSLPGTHGRVVRRRCAGERRDTVATSPLRHALATTQIRLPAVPRHLTRRDPAWDPTPSCDMPAIP